MTKTKEDLLKEFYDWMHRDIDPRFVPAFKNITKDQKKAIENTMVFQGFVTSYHWQELKKSIKESLPKPLKRWFIRS